MRVLAALVILASSSAFAETGLIFPSNDDAPYGDVYAFKWDDPEANFGLPMWGTADGGITYTWEYQPYANQDGYYVTFFWSRGDGGFESGGYQQFYGAHPYPWVDDGSNAGLGRYGAPSETHAWEISNGIGVVPSDSLQLANGDPGKYVEYNRWYHQAFTATKSGNTITYRFYFDLPKVTTEHYIEVSRTKNMPDPTDPVLYFGDNPWWPEVRSHERMNGIFRNLKIIDATLTQAEILQEADSDVLATAAARNSVFYHNPNPTPDDIMDKSGRGNHPSWVDDAHKPGLYSSAEPPGSEVPSANRDDTTLFGLRVTVKSVNDFDVTIEVAGQGSDSAALPSARLGSEFFYDYRYYPGLNSWTNAVPPAIDWGDGSSIANVGIPYTGTNAANGTTTFDGQFMHTYAAPGNYTIRSFGTNIRIATVATPSASVLSGNLFSTLSPGVIYNQGTYTNTARSTGTVPIGLTNTATVSVPAVVNVGGAGGGGGGCGLIGIELIAVYPVWLLARKRRRPGAFF